MIRLYTYTFRHPSSAFPATLDCPAVDQAAAWRSARRYLRRQNRFLIGVLRTLAPAARRPLIRLPQAASEMVLEEARSKPA